MLGLIEYAMRTMQRLVHLAIPRRKSPAGYRLLVRAMEKRLVYDRRTRTGTVRKGELRSAKKYGPFCEADFAFALGGLEPEITAAFREHVRPGMTVFEQAQRLHAFPRAEPNHQASGAGSSRSYQP